MDQEMNMANLNLKLYTLMNMLIALVAVTAIISGMAGMLDIIPPIFSYMITATVVFFAMGVALCAVHCTHKNIKQVGWVGVDDD
jgi:hypothetical protein